MGSCASVDHSNAEPDMKLRLSFGSKTDKVVIPSSLVKEKSNNGNFPIDDIGVKSHWSPSRSSTNFRDCGSKEEAFFDSKPWLDSDGEDDFYSVNGEFTPSRGNTPVHHSFRTPNVNKTPSPPKPSPTGKKKNLLELFRESVRDNHEDENTLDPLNAANGKIDVKPTIQDVLPKSAQSTPYIFGANSVCNSERTISDNPLSVRERSIKSMQCCLPGLISCRSFSERRKTSPAVAANGKP